MSLYKENKNFVNMICSYLESRVGVWSEHTIDRFFCGGSVSVPIFNDVGYSCSSDFNIYFKPTKNIIMEERRGKLLYIGLELKTSKIRLDGQIDNDIYESAWTFINFLINFGWSDSAKVKAREEFYKFVRDKYSIYSNSTEEEIKQQCIDTKGQLVKDSPYIKKAIDFINEFSKTDFEFNRKNVFKEINNKKLIPICYIDFEKSAIYFLQRNYNKPTEKNCFDCESFGTTPSYGWSNKGKKLLEDSYKYLPREWVSCVPLDQNLKIRIW